MKKWEFPVIEVLSITDTAWETPDGEELDGMYSDCYALYVGS